VRALLAVSLLWACLVDGQALAKCRSPRATLIPADGRIPVAAKLWLLVPTIYSASPSLTADVRVLQRKVPIPAVVTRVNAASKHLQVFLITIAASDVGPLVVELDDHDRERRQTWSLEVESAWKASPLRHVAPTVERTESSWTCSHELAQHVAFPSLAAGYRILLMPTPDGPVSDDVDSIYLPATGAMFWSDPPKRVATANLGVGYLNCFGATFDFAGRAVWAEIRALLPDGSEPVITSQRIKIPAPERAADPGRPIR
jgi:hypothetical protein